MSDSDGRPEGQQVAIPVAEFEGVFVRSFESALPAITLDMPEGYLRGTHLRLDVEVRVRNVSFNEGKQRRDGTQGDLTRHHALALEEVRLAEAFDPMQRPTNVGGNSAGDYWVEELVGFLEGEHDELDFDGHPIPDRLQGMLKLYFEHIDLEARTKYPAQDVDF